MNLTVNNEGRVDLWVGPLFCKFNCKSAYHDISYSIIYWHYKLIWYS